MEDIDVIEISSDEDHESDDEESNLHSECLEKFFGLKKFSLMQRGIISNILKEKNVFAVTTEYEKFLCFHYPSVFLRSSTIIISPHVSIMQDQELLLKVNNIKACLFDKREKIEIFDNICSFKYNLIYMTPEMIITDLGNIILEKLHSKLSLIAIDLAQCISKIKDFEKVFKKLQQVPEIPILVITSTATEKFKSDISKLLESRNPVELFVSFYMPDVELNVRSKDSKEDIWSDIQNLVGSIHKEGSAIIYCLSKEKVVIINEILQSKNIECQAYHEGISCEERVKIFKKFVNDDIKVMVTTIKHGIGIKKSNIRLVVHYEIPENLESYYQGIACAGLDGFPSKCILFCTRGNLCFRKALRENTNGPEDWNENNKISNTMRDYIKTTNCRHNFIRQFFGEETVEVISITNCCDNCQNLNSTLKNLNKYRNLDENGHYDFTLDASNLLKVIHSLKKKTTLQTVIYILSGSKNVKLKKKFYSHKLYGAGKEMPMKWHKLLTKLLISEKFLCKRGNIVLTEVGKNWLKNSEKSSLKLKPNLAMLEFLKIKPLSIKEIQQKMEIFRNLLKVRERIAMHFKVMPHMIVTNKALNTLVEKKPLNLDELKHLELDSFSDTIINKYGKEFVSCILYTMNLYPVEIVTYKDKLIELLQQSPLINSKTKLNEKYLTVYGLWKEGKNVKEIASFSIYSEESIAGCMNELIKKGYCCTKTDLRKLDVDPFHFKAISSQIPSELSNENLKTTLKKIKKQYPSATINMIKYVLSYHQVRRHLMKISFDFESDTDETEDKNNFPNERERKEIANKICKNFRESGTDDNRTFNEDMEELPSKRKLPSWLKSANCA